MEGPEDPEQDEVQRLLNDAKRAELEEQYGMRFFRAENSPVSPDLEALWLEHVAEFERQYAAGENVTLREFVGRPAFRKADDLAPAEVEEELDRLLDHLNDHDVCVDFPDAVDPSLAYRYIVEELLDEEIPDIRMPGMRLHFVFQDES